jgi:hypothetical protein
MPSTTMTQTTKVTLALKKLQFQNYSQSGKDSLRFSIPDKPWQWSHTTQISSKKSDIGDGWNPDPIPKVNLYWQTFVS